ncbi:insulinase family protein [uncultured Psychroserpens sp.]|uniref:M16 family metallopeptidase n=1 Tax=uncultured Psychroserpens sp. TaxID=255436 RepID=UPI0026363122|nr:insulinase family protein [uncultured Psychroserpens sp.]
MRIFNLFVLFIVCSNVNSQVDSLLLDYQYYTLSNGLEIVLQPDETTKAVSVEFWLKNGTSLDSRNQYGLQHFFEHIMPYSPMDSIKRKKLFKEYYHNSNAQVKKDFTRFYWESKSEGLELVIERTSGRLKAGAKAIQDKNVEYQRKRVIEEIERNAKNPIWSAQGSLIINEGTFGENHPYTANGYGNIANNKNFQLDDLRMRYDDIIYSNNVVLFVVGNFEIEKAKSLIENYFRNIPSKQKLPSNIKNKKIDQSTGKIIMKAPHPNDSINTIVFSWAIPKLKIEEEAAIQLIASHLNNTFKAKHFFPSSIIKCNVKANFYMNAAQFLVQIQFSNAEESILIKELVLSKIRNLAKKPISILDLENAIKLEIANVRDQQKSLGFQWSRTELLGKSLLNHGNPNAYFEKLQIQQHLTAEQIKKSAKQWISNDPFKVLFTANK